MNKRTKTLTTIAMFSAIAYVVMVVGRIPLVLFLKYDPKDIIITIAGFIYGPFTSFLISFFVSVAEMFTVSDTGFIGVIMNVIGSSAFACTAAYIYKKKHTISGAIIGLIVGCITMTIVMILWNYLATPIYMGIPRESVIPLLASAILPFNLIKGSINVALTMILYKPIVNALRKSNLIAISNSNPKGSTYHISILLICLLVLITCIFFVLVMKGIV